MSCLIIKLKDRVDNANLSFFDSIACGLEIGSTMCFSSAKETTINQIPGGKSRIYFDSSKVKVYLVNYWTRKDPSTWVAVNSGDLVREYDGSSVISYLFECTEKTKVVFTNKSDLKYFDHGESESEATYQYLSLSTPEIFGMVTLEEFRGTGTRGELYGDIREIGRNNKLKTLTLAGGGVVGELSTIGFMPSLESINVSTTSVNGKLEDFAAAYYAAGKRSGSIRVVTNAIVTLNNAACKQYSITTITFTSGGYSFS